MPRPSLTSEERERGVTLGRALATSREATGRSAEKVASDAGVSVETVRSIERGRVPNPGIFTVVAIARTLQLDIDELATKALSRRRKPRR